MANFLSEAGEHLEGIETRLVYLEQHPEDLEAVNAIFRPFHTIKGWPASQPGPDPGGGP